ncbi:MAG: sensor histidine kinase [Cytophagaceae bacterium]
MIDFFRKLFETDFWPHGHCYFWQPEILYTHAISDLIISLAYFTIPLSLVYIFSARKDYRYVWLLILFAIFIFGCGTTHVFAIINIWTPMYRLDGLVKGLTALASIGTAAMLIKLTPNIILIPSADTFKKLNSDLQTANINLKESNEELMRSEEMLRELNTELEDRVELRTNEVIKSNERFKFLVETVPQLIWITNPDGSNEFFNQHWVNYVGHTPKHFNDNTWKEIIHPEDYEQATNKWVGALESGNVFEFEMRLRHQETGEFRWFLARALPMKDFLNEENKWFGSFTDIHSQKEFQEELKVKNDDLVKTNNDLDNFVYTASHDLKAPISNLEGLIAALKEKNLAKVDSEDRMLFEMIETSIGKFSNTIKDLTEITKVQKDIGEEKETIKFEEILNEVMTDLKGMINESGADIHLDVKKKTLRFARKNLRSIIYNLLSNAIKYRSPDRKPLISIKTYEESGKVYLVVEDNGLGLNLERDNKLFSMFKRYHDHVEGSGIGLYIVKRIMDNNRGQIEVSSKRGEGTRFKLYFQKQD